MKGMFNNKKGQILQVAFILVVIVGLGITLLVAAKVLGAFFSAVDDSGMNNTYTEQVEVSYDAVPATFDYSMIFIVMGLTIALLVTSFLIPSHPIFMVINVFGIFFLVFLGMIMSNFFGEMVAGEAAVFATEAELYPVTMFVIQYLPYIAATIVFISTIIMFAKGREGSAF